MFHGCFIMLLFIGFSGMLMAQGKIKFTKQDSVKLTYCRCDSLNALWKTKPNPRSEQPEFDGNGWHRILNFEGKVGQCGYFNKFYFLYGLHFTYDENGNITRIRKYFNGKIIGNCDLKK